jgi:glycosyltransferase involved in cell wall biosynthesis
VEKLRETWNITNRFVVGYFGNLGRAHDYSTIVDAADSLREDTSIVFLIVGGGHHHSSVREVIVKRALESSFTFLPYQDLDQLSASLAVPDVHWLSLKEGLEGLIVPSKFYGMLAAGRPIIAIGDPDGEIGKLVRESECGFAISTGDSYSLVKAIQDLKTSAVLREDMGKKSLTLLQMRFGAPHAYMRWEKALAKAMHGGSSDRNLDE